MITRIIKSSGMTCVLTFVAVLVGSAQARQQDVLNMIWRSDNGGDLFETNSASETIFWGNTNAMFYLFKNQLSGTSPVYRLINPAEHMVSTSTSESGYTLEGLLGYAYNSSQTGMMELVRKYNSSTGDHGLSHDSETLSGYSDERMSRWGYRRYGTAVTSLLSLSAGGVTIESNLQAGGSLWSWTWNGVQFVNDGDYGRQIQTSMFIGDSAWWADKATGTAPYANPTEAGSNNGDPLGPLSQGSPLLSASNSGNTQTTRCRPLDFNPAEYSPIGGSGENPVLYSDMVMGKDITLNFAGLGSVAKYSTHLEIADTVTSDVIEIPSVYLRPIFTRFYTYEAASDTLTEISFPVGDDTVAFTPSSGYGGAILATSDENYAFGIYAVTTAQGGSMNGDCFRFFSGDSGGGSGQYDGGWRKVNVTYWGTFTAGTHTYNSYLVSGTLSDVQSKMQSLYSGNYK